MRGEIPFFYSKQEERAYEQAEFERYCSERRETELRWYGLSEATMTDEQRRAFNRYLLCKNSALLERFGRPRVPSGAMLSVETEEESKARWALEELLPRAQGDDDDDDVEVKAVWTFHDQAEQEGEE